MGGLFVVGFFLAQQKRAVSTYVLFALLCCILSYFSCLVLHIQMADSPAKFSDEGKPYEGTETPFGHVHHMADSVTTVKYAEVYNNFKQKPKLRIDGYAACRKNKFCGKIVELNDTCAWVINASTNRRRKINNPVAIHAVNEYVQEAATNHWFRIAFHGTASASLRQVYVASGAGASGSTVVENDAVAENAAGTVVAENVDGTAVAENADGTAVAENAAGTAVAENADGTAMAENADASAVAENADGSAVAVNAAETVVAENADGSAVAVNAAGTVVAENAVVSGPADAASATRIATPSADQNAPAAGVATVVEEVIKPEMLTPHLVCTHPEKYMNAFLMYWCLPSQLPDITHAVILKPEQLR